MLRKNGRGVIRLGDKTDHGGHVTSVSAHQTDEHIRIARIGDMTYCPKCEGNYEIVEGDHEFKIDGIPVSFHHHKTACGASLISTWGHIKT